MSVERKPASFGDQRGWIEALRKEGQLHESPPKSIWNIELRHHHAAGTRDRRRTRAPLQQHQDYTRRLRAPAKVRLLAVDIAASQCCSVSDRHAIRASW